MHVAQSCGGPAVGLTSGACCAMVLRALLKGPTRTMQRKKGVLKQKEVAKAAATRTGHAEANTRRDMPPHARAERRPPLVFWSQLAGPGGVRLQRARLLTVLLVLCACSTTADSASSVRAALSSLAIVTSSDELRARGVQDLLMGEGLAFVLQNVAGKREAVANAAASCKRSPLREDGPFATTALLGGPTQLKISCRSQLQLAAHGIKAASCGFGGFGRTAQSGLGKTPTEEKAPVKSVSPDVFGEDDYSAQERRMLCVLSKFGRLHTPPAPEEHAVSRKKLCVAGQTAREQKVSAREQKEEMAKDRRDEKVALRHRQGEIL